MNPVAMCCESHWILWRILLASVLMKLSSAQSELATTNGVRTETVCPSMDIRNHVDYFDLLENCTVIEGHLQIVLIEHALSSDYETKTFPRLREITEYLLLYRVYGLKTLSHIFPNLSVIRGQFLFHNYALIVFEVPDLEELGLASLTSIARGSVRLEKNQNLCYIDTIDWKSIIHFSTVDNFIVHNKKLDECVDVCAKDCDNKELCWTENKCQIVCPGTCGHRRCYTALGTHGPIKDCCHSECLGGCYGPRNSDCFACEKMFHQGRCIQECPIGTYEYLERRCITEQECRALENTWKVMDNGKCLEKCPTGYMQLKDESDPHVCVPCVGPCPKVCLGLVIDNVAAAQKLEGCTEIRGILEISIRGGTQVELELEKYLGRIERVTMYIRIIQSSALSTLNFFKGLKSIDGVALYNSYALFVLDNHNLQDIWDFNTHPELRIGKGKVFFQFNRKLCLHKIEHFVKMVGLENVTSEMDVSQSNNGDLIACNMTQIDLSVYRLADDYVIIRWSNFHTNDARELLSWVVSYREAPEKNLTMFDARDACGTNVWKTNDVNPDPDKNSRTIANIIYGLRPNTQYAVYVHTYTIASAKRGAVSAIIYFTTDPYIPTSPQDVTIETPCLGELKVSWKPPKEPNGNVTHYYVRWQPQKLETSKFDLRDYCVDKLQGNAKKPGEGPTEAEEEEERQRLLDEAARRNNATMVPAGECCTCPKSDHEREKDEEERQIQIEFENYLQNSVYRTRPMSDDSYGKKRRKRSEMFYAPPGLALTSNGTVGDVGIANMTDLEIIDTVPEEEEHEDEEVYQFVVVENKLEVILTDLENFVEYSIEVIACQDFRPGQQEKYCSQRAITSARTLPLPAADMVDIRNVTAVNHTSTNRTGPAIQIRWLPPVNPNGLILNYEIQYRRENLANAESIPFCITHKKYREIGGYNLVGLAHGHYRLRLRTTSLAGYSEWTEYVAFYVPEIEQPQRSLIPLAVSVCVVCALVVAIAMIFGVFYYRHKRSNVPEVPLYTSVNPDYMGFTEVYLPDEWEVDSSKVELVKEIGQGSFGKVYEGIANYIAQEDMEPEFHGRIRVAVKTVFESASVRDKMEFLNEASVMKAFRSYHVLRLLGVVSKTQPTYVIMEFMANGDLKTFLRMHRPDYEEGNPRRPPSVRQVIQMAGEIADGMAYLTDKKFVHRDLAARNCMVNEKMVVKIGDFGMTRDVYDTDYYRKSGKGCLPVRWMAPESLHDGTYTSQSDVWSYGVVIWEMATLAAQPYQGLSNEEVLKFVVDKNLMDIPEKCPEKLSKLMLRCWEYRERDRPTFEGIINYLEPDLSEEFVERSFYHNTTEHISTAAWAEGDDVDEETCMDYESEGEDISPATPLTGTPKHVTFGSLSDARSTRSSLSYDSRKPSPANTPYQNSYLQSAASPATAGMLGTGDSGKPYPWLAAQSGALPRTLMNGPSGPPISPHQVPSVKDPVVLKETAHLWQRPKSPSGGASNNHSASDSATNPKANGAQGVGTTDSACSAESGRPEGSESSGSGSGRNGYINGHIHKYMPTAQC